MVGIVMHKQTLAAKCQHSLDLAKPLIHPGKIFLVVPAIDRICLIQAARDDLGDPSGRWEVDTPQPRAEALAQLFIAHLPFRMSGVRGKLRAENGTAVRFCRDAEIFGFGKREIGIDPSGK